MAKDDVHRKSQEGIMKGHKVKGLSGHQKGHGHAEMGAMIHGLRTDKEKSMHTNLSTKTHKGMHKGGGHHSGNKRGY